MIRFCYLLLFIFLSLTACKQTTGKQGNGGPEKVYSVVYAEGFKVEYGDGYTDVKIRDPWDTVRCLHHYVLVPKTQALPANLPTGATLVRTPLSRIVACTSVHCGLLEMLGITGELVGVCESRYIDVDFVRQGIAAGSIIDLGEASAPDIEQLIELSPDAMITSPLSNGPNGRVEKTGIPQIKCIDYMEPTPLGRAEWIRFHGLFLEKEALADSLFQQTVKAYNDVKALVQKVEKRPSVIAEMKTGPMWYIPGGKSYIANLYRDAGADYSWNDDTHTGSVPMAFEVVLEKSGQADFWLIKYNRPEDMTYDGLKAAYGANVHFAAFKNRHIFGCNTGMVPYYEEMPIHPDYLLKDLVWIFHPELLPGYQPRYYKKMQE